jgi:hypothetical protein
MSLKKRTLDELMSPGYICDIIKQRTSSNYRRGRIWPRCGDKYCRIGEVINRKYPKQVCRANRMERIQQDRPIDNEPITHDIVKKRVRRAYYEKENYEGQT